MKSRAPRLTLNSNKERHCFSPELTLFPGELNFEQRSVTPKIYFNHFQYSPHKNYSGTFTSTIPVLGVVIIWMRYSNLNDTAPTLKQRLEIRIINEVTTINDRITTRRCERVILIRHIYLRFRNTFQIHLIVCTSTLSGPVVNIPSIK